MVSLGWYLNSRLQSQGFAANPLASPVLAHLFNGRLKEDIFAIWLAPYGGEEGGELSLGAVNEARFTGNISWVDTINPGIWELPLTSVSISGVQVESLASRALMYLPFLFNLHRDTSNEFIELPTADFVRINKVLGIDDPESPIAYFGIFNFFIERLWKLAHCLRFVHL
jgi:hypothetical protein